MKLTYVSTSIGILLRRSIPHVLDFLSAFRPDRIHTRLHCYNVPVMWHWISDLIRLMI